MKCVMIVDEDLPIGLIANATAVLGISLSQEKEGLVGDAVIDGDGNWHLGITNVAIPILKMTSSELKKCIDGCLIIKMKNSCISLLMMLLKSH